MLARLAKTNMTAPEELEMKRQYPRWFNEQHALPNPLFLFATEQLSDTNVTRLDILRRDVQHFVGFEEEMSLVPHTKPGKDRNADKQAEIDKNKIDICNAEYVQVRESLMKTSRSASIRI